MKSIVRTLNPEVRTSPQCVTVAVLLALALASTASGQYLEHTIQLPDSGIPAVLCYVPERGNLYCADIRNSMVLEIDAAADSITARIDVLAEYGPHDFCYNAARGKLYCTDYSWHGSIAVVDVWTRGVSWIREIENPGRIRCSPDGDFVYCLYGSGMMCVVDARGDTIIARLPVGSSPCELCCIPTEQKLYISNDWDTLVTIVDAVTLRVTGSIPTVTHPMGLCYNWTNQKVYNSTSCCNGVAVIDAASDSVIVRFSLSDPVGMCYNGNNNAVYVACLSGGQVVMIDGHTNHITGAVPLPFGPCGLCLDEAHNKLYCGSGMDDSLVVIDCGTGSVTRRFQTGRNPRSMAWNPQRSRVYVANRGSSSISVIRDTTAGIAEGEGGGTRLPRAAATVVRGVLNVPRDMTDFRSGKSDRVPRPRATLLDASGRRVMELAPGPNDVSHLSPGVYFIQSPIPGRRSQPATKVIIQS